MAQTLTTSGVCIKKAGTKVSSDLTGTGADAYWNEFIEEAEAVVSAATRFDWVTNYPTLSGKSVMKILDGTVSDLAAIYGITYDMSGYTTRIEAEDMINVLRDKALFNIAILRDKKVQRFIQEA